MTYVELLEGMRIKIVRDRGDGETIILTNAEVCMAAAVMRDAMLQALPVVVPVNQDGARSHAIHEPGTCLLCDAHRTCPCFNEWGGCKHRSAKPHPPRKAALVVPAPLHAQADGVLVTGPLEMCSHCKAR